MVFKKGMIPWNKYLTKETDERVRKNTEHQRINNVMKRPEVKEKQSETRKRLFKLGILKISNSCFKKGNIPWSLGKTKEDFPQLSNAGVKKGTIPWNKDKEYIKIKGKNHFNWRGGTSFEPYGLEFNKKLKKKIRYKYNKKCAECNYSEEFLKYRLSIHHIDFNKNNNSENNLIPLCKSCHSQTNYNRNDWTKYFQNKLKGGVKL